MKVLARKRYYEEDLYSISGLGGKYRGGLTEKDLKDYVEGIRNLSEIEHKRGDFDRWEVKAKEYCCDDLKEYGRAQVEWYDPTYSDRRQHLGMFLPFQGYGEADYVKIDYCPFCGEKIEVVEEE